MSHANAYTPDEGYVAEVVSEEDVLSGSTGSARVFEYRLYDYANPEYYTWHLPVLQVVVAAEALPTPAKFLSVEGAFIDLIDEFNAKASASQLDIRIEYAGISTSAHCGDGLRNVVVVCGMEDLKELDPKCTTQGGCMRKVTRIVETDTWQEASAAIDNDMVVWSPEIIASGIMHEILHVLGFAHEDTVPSLMASTLGTYMRMTETDLAGLQYLYPPDRCALEMSNDGHMRIPYVKYAGVPYWADVQLVFDDLGRPQYLQVLNTGRHWISPGKGCERLQFDGDALRLPQIWWNGQLFEVDVHMQFASGRLNITYGAKVHL